MTFVLTRISCRFWLAALLLAFTPLTAFAQFDSGTLLGRVLDQSDAAIPGATVTLTNVATGIQATAVTDDTGSYQFLNVRVGTYRVEAKLTGFATAVATDVNVTVNARQRVDLALKVGGLGETVEVTGAARRLEADSSDRGQVITRAQIINLPLNGRAYADLALLSPGVRSSSISSSRDASFNVNGMRSSLNNFILDGVDNNSYGTSNQGFSNQVVQVSPDAVEEFKVQTNNFSAEFGRAGGAVINATFRSGTNQFRGTAWEFFRNTALNAIGYFKPTTGKPTLERNQFGGVFGGPIVRSRAFFFVNYEGFRQTQRTVTFAEHSDRGPAPGCDGQAGGQPADGRGVCGRRHPGVRHHAVRGQGPGRPSRAHARGNQQQLRHAAANARTRTTSSTSSSTSSCAPGRTLFVRVSHRKVNNFEPPPIPGETASPANAFVEVLNQQYVRRRDAYAVAAIGP